MAIQDLVGNALLGGTTAQMLGYQEVVEAELLPLRMYDFLIRPIRDEDRLQGALFVQRFLAGGQQQWADFQAQVFDLKDLGDVTKCPDALLPYLKNIVGWTEEPLYTRVTDGLEADALRRLIAASASLWKGRGPEDRIAGTLGFLTGQRVRVWNWFDFRWVLDETALGEDHQGRDPWVIDLPGEGDDDRRFNVRIVDPGEDQRPLVSNTLKVLRPLGERIEVSFLRFLDTFTTDQDNIQWTGAPTVADGRMQLTDTGSAEEAVVAATDALAWDTYAAYWRVQCGTADCYLYFYRTDADNFYCVTVDVAGDQLLLERYVAGFPLVLGTYAVALGVDEWLGIRVAIQNTGAANQIRLYLDGELILEVSDASQSSGAVGMGHATGGSLLVDEVEVIPIPMDNETIDINAS